MQNGHPPCTLQAKPLKIMVATGGLEPPTPAL